MSKPHDIQRGKSTVQAWKDREPTCALPLLGRDAIGRVGHPMLSA